MKLHAITITGADDSIKPLDIIELSKKYPYTEWGLLLSISSAGCCRFPSLEWMKSLVDSLDQTKTYMRLSGHFCGRLVTNFVNGRLPLPDEIPPWLWKKLHRVQINFHGVPQKPKKEFYGSLLKEMKGSKKQFIFQADGVNEDLFWGVRNYKINAVPLFDLSHGGGVLPNKWPKPFSGVMCGYAGGLGPQNLQDQIDKISSIVGDHDIWIDMETNVRSNGDRQFDLDKVETCLKIANPYIIK